MEGQALVEDCEYFTVETETTDFVCLRINQKGSFKVRQLSPMQPSHVPEFLQFMMNEKNLSVLGLSGSHMVCKKIEVKQ